MSIASRRYGSKRFAFAAPVAFVAAVVMAACGSSSNAGSSFGGDGGQGDGGGPDGCVGAFAGSPGCGGDPCAGLGCASMTGPLRIRVLDPGGSPIPSPTFNSDGVVVEAICETDAGQILEDAGTCDPWTIDTLGAGPHSLTISASGYESVFTSVTLSGPADCCGIGPTVDTTVTLSAIADASDDGPG